MGQTIQQLLERHEGRKNKPYRDTEGLLTIGVGWCIDRVPLPADIAAYLKRNGEITDDMIDQLLAISVGSATLNCHRLFPDFDKFSPNRQMAFIDMVFNLGYTGVSRFVHMVAAANTGRWDDVGKEIKNSRWYEQLPNRAEEDIELIQEA